MIVRLVLAEDLDAWARLRHALWPTEAASELREEAARLLGRSESTPVFVAAESRELLGVAEFSLHEAAPGCTTSPVAYLEGWYVIPAARRRGVGRALVDAGRRWALDRGCREMASDTTAEYPGSPAAHRALGFTEVDPPLHFRMDLTTR